MAAASFEPCSGCAKTRDRLVAGRCLFGFESDDLHFGGREEGCEGWLEDMEDGEQHALRAAHDEEPDVFGLLGPRCRR